MIDFVSMYINENKPNFQVVNARNILVFLDCQKTLTFSVLAVIRSDFFASGSGILAFFPLVALVTVFS